MATANISDIFSDILERAKALDPAHTRKWFSDLRPGRFAGGHLEVGCPDAAKARFLSDNCSSTFTRAAQQITGHLVSVSFAVAEQNGTQNQNHALPHLPRLHLDYTFENFVVGPCNRLAHASCIAVSRNPADSYNPLFLYGSVGLGKTHLLHAICHELLHRNPLPKIQFLSCEEFVNRFITSIELGRASEFQNEFRTVDVLIIDDVQFLREREQSQEEFFHTFNALYHSHKQIILSADNAPGEIPSLEDRLISRFKWGLVAKLDPPTYETRIAIIKKKAHLRGLELEEGVVEYIGQKVDANIRELEGALTTVHAQSMALGERITCDLAKKALGGDDTAEKHISISMITEVVTAFYGVRLADLQSKKRSQSITLPRQICMYLARNLTRHSLEEIGGHLGGRDHTTVMHACAKIAELEQNDHVIKSQIAEILKQIKQL
ncbi:MAG TPA: chromosomal replication initiator protein DnaA [Sedimentisphaerales bacterium]|nr:chromosomal replication initiator protein DnaA [Sedimentisphaerales bacterium]